MKQLINYIKPYKIQATLAPFFKMLEAIFELCIPLLLARMIDSPSKQALLPWILSLLLLAILSILVSLTAQYFSAQSSVGFAHELRQDLFKKMVNLDEQSFEEKGKQAWIHRFIVDIDNLQHGVNLFFRLILRAPIILLGAIIMVSIVSMPMSFIFIIIILILSLGALVLMKKSLKPQKAVQSSLETILTHTQNFLSGIRVIRAYHQQSYEQQQFEQETNELSRQQMRLASITSLTHPFTIILINLGIIAILWLGNYNISIGSLTQGQVVALVNYMMAILSEFLKMLLLVPVLVKALTSAEKISDFLSNDYQTTQYKENDMTKNESIISFQNVSYQYPNASSPALTRVSFNVETGTSVGIIGGIGSGKSTLGYLISGIYQPTSGKIKVDKTVSMATQKAQFFHGTIESNLTLAKEDATTEEMLEAIKLACANDILLCEADLQKTVQTFGKNFSGGQRQRLSLARALIKSSDIVVLDDVSFAVDGITEKQLKEMIQSLKKTRIVISQKVSFIAHLDQILVLDQGELVASGTHQTLLQTSKVYQEICHSQGVELYD